MCIKNSNSNSNISNSSSTAKFAIFITSYNYGKYIAQAIESVINQSDPNWQLYIIDDNSTDNTFEIVEKYLKKDKRISWKKHSKNIGSVPTIIEGFSEIDADYISTLCSDDWLAPNFVSDAKKAFAENPEIPFCALGWSACAESEYFANKHQTFVERVTTPLSKNFCGKVYLSPYLVFENFINLDFLVFKKSCLNTVLHNLEHFKLRQFLEPFLMKCLENKFGASYFNNSSPHGFWRRHNKQLTQKNHKISQVEFERFSEPLFCICENSTQNLANLANLANNFMNLIRCVHREKISYRIATEWLLSDLGRPFAEKFGSLDFQFIKENDLEKSLLCLAICVWSSYIFNYENGGWEKDLAVAKKQLGDWIVDVQTKYGLQNILEMYQVANKLYDGLFMPLIK